MRANFERCVDQITQNVITLLNIWKIQTIGSKLSVSEKSRRVVESRPVCLDLNAKFRIS
jgi:translation initiation factor 2 gamma subunit (eIF-2gamma)